MIMLNVESFMMAKVKVKGSGSQIFARFGNGRVRVESWYAVEIWRTGEPEIPFATRSISMQRFALFVAPKPQSTRPAWYSVAAVQQQ